ncbi:MAG: prephenate dehydratase [Clostridium sp.]|jgi:chorismate mutase/prephenate dehydratase|uniref:prephenate dehydratase n=1 Tax=Clostridium sp. TaxID=1506 RepID=UPI0025BCFFF7|nr:prephenate dehydratase [Clostridium sp.]MCH3964931.1 prephenate dehydratase [Clostridium sp.]MCI1716575.1 prephenate dehydratase [Clostridium sp.]MCI1800943.1 prephenate dehydratase [Clostridium sp.]MCI1814752.1 prephenate dehydratase [Clostridium sp.]MCI1871690.1 prephenate dehydratase [Clostridium sp.]
MKIGFYGVEASFSHEALVEYFGNTGNILSCAEFKDVFDAIESDTAKYGVIPIENSSTGSINEVYDLLRNYGFYIVGEKCIKVNHNLLGIKGASIDDIEEIYSHSQAFMQSKEFLANRRLKLVPYFSTAGSAKYISEEGCKSKGCIASKRAGKLYNLDILQEDINYNKKNYTRFIIIGKSMEVNDDSDKISIVFTLEHKVGTLFNILKHFEENDLNMTKIESRPKIDSPWQYYFYIDFYGNLNDRNAQKVVEKIKNECEYFKLLGNYTSDHTI